MTLEQIDYKLTDGVALITLNRPQAMNAFTIRMGRELTGLIREIDKDDAVKAVVVTGAGDQFCAGMDLSAGGSTFDLDADPLQLELDEDGTDAWSMALAIHRNRKPVIAAINGAAVGVGLSMTLPMDIRVAAQGAKTGFVFTRRGVTPEACAAWFLPRIIGPARAAELVFTGRTFRPEDPEAAGLFNYVVPADQVLDRALALAREIADKASPACVSLSKYLLRQGIHQSDPEKIAQLDARIFMWLGSQADAYEGVQSFLEKRPPRFSLSPSRDLPWEIDRD